MKTAARSALATVTSILVRAGFKAVVHTGRNQHGDIVATATRKAMMRKKPMEDTN